MKTSSLTFYISLITLFISASCATSRPPKTKKTYSSEVEQEFKDIEYDQKRVLNYYRTLREKNWDEYKKGQNTKRRRPRRYQRPKRRSQPQRSKTVRKVVPEKPALSDARVEELNIEIQQNLDYFCMKNRKSSRFSNQQDCKSYTENIFDQCKQQHPVYRDRSPVQCVKNRLN
ncbi:MAG: hypothetical protein CME63_05460 [Halobacteriovoraceae bacterium]|nr:hypothetical protein [Halobacteriovoraceae bacterium]|tara:strand:- start:111037 stop:111555 length:519 start_codon:yes stop_codon:yes gene_type:complete